MRVSFVIVSYNENEYLEKAVLSCLRQDVFSSGIEAEILIGDDGSTDGSIKTIERLENKYPAIIKHYVMERNNNDIVIISLRVSKVLKRGFELSTGDYIQVLSADDLLIKKDKVSEAVAFLSNHNDYSCCYSDYK